MRFDPREARNVLHRCVFAALATHSNRLAGFPFVSHVPFALDASHCPVLLLSGLAEHTRNLDLDPRASLMASVAGPDPQTQPRLTLIGRLLPLEAGPSLMDRYLRYHPEATQFIGFGDFRFFRLEPLRIRLIAGFARAGWLEAGDWRVARLSESDEAGLLSRLQGELAEGWRLLGMDREGLDLIDPTGRHVRQEFMPPLPSAEDLLEAALALLQALPPQPSLPPSPSTSPTTLTSSSTPASTASSMPQAEDSGQE